MITIAGKKEVVSLWQVVPVSAQRTSHAFSLLGQPPFGEHDGIMQLCCFGFIATVGTHGVFFGVMTNNPNRAIIREGAGGSAL